MQGRFRFVTSVSVLVVALAAVGVGFSGLLGTTPPVTVTEPLVLTFTETTSVTATVTQVASGLTTTTTTVTETTAAPPATACRSAPPVNGTALVPLVQVEIDPIDRGTNQALYVTVCYAGLGVADAAVSGTITDPMGNEWLFSGTTDASGLYTYGWQIDATANPGTFTVVARAGKPGYTEGTGSTSFDVTLPGA